MTTININQEGILIIKVTRNNLSTFDTNDFVELFLPKYPLHQYSDLIDGIASLNYLHKTFNIRLSNPASTLQPILDKFQDGVWTTLPNGNKIKISATKLLPPIQTVTLYPLPHGVTFAQIKALTTTWGTLVSANYGRYRTLPHIKNAYFHIKLRDLKTTNVPKRITVNGHYVAVMTPGENGILRCGLCKAKGHKTNDCPTKTGYQQQTHKPQPPNPWNTPFNKNQNHDQTPTFPSYPPTAVSSLTHKYTTNPQPNPFPKPAPTSSPNTSRNLFSAEDQTQLKHTLDLLQTSKNAPNNTAAKTTPAPELKSTMTPPVDPTNPALSQSKANPSSNQNNANPIHLSQEKQHLSSTTSPTIKETISEPKPTSPLSNFSQNIIKSSIQKENHVENSPTNSLTSSTSSVSLTQTTMDSPKTTTPFITPDDEMDGLIELFTPTEPTKTPQKINHDNKNKTRKSQKRKKLN